MNGLFAKREKIKIRSKKVQKGPKRSKKVQKGPKRTGTTFKFLGLWELKLSIKIPGLKNQGWVFFGVEKSCKPLKGRFSPTPEGFFLTLRLAALGGENNFVVVFWPLLFVLTENWKKDYYNNSQSYLETIPILRQHTFVLFLTHLPIISINSTEHQQKIPFFWPLIPSSFVDVIQGWSLTLEGLTKWFQFHKFWIPIFWPKKKEKRGLVLLFDWMLKTHSDWFKDTFAFGR